MISLGNYEYVKWYLANALNLIPSNLHLYITKKAIKGKRRHKIVN